MKKGLKWLLIILIFIIIIGVNIFHNFFVKLCSGEGCGENLPDYQEIIDECDSLCNIDKEKYCSEERVIVLPGDQIIGTCRSFAHQGNVSGFNRCPGFCKEYGPV